MSIVKDIYGKKTKVDQLAVFNGKALFPSPKSTSNLVKPDFEKFANYSRVFFEAHQYTNNGSLVRQLEHRLASFHQVKFCITFCNGFWGLVLAISALAIKGKTEVVIPSLTYRRMADVIAWTKLKPNFCEVNSHTLASTPSEVLSCINPNTALILAVHPIINCCDVDGLVELARQRNIPLLFDSVESVYESTGSGKIGSFGDAEVFSMHASKLLNGFEGGYLTTNNSKLAEQLALMRGFGFNGPDNIVVKPSINAKLNEVHAAMALASLDDIGDQIVRNRNRYYAYKQLLSDIEGIRLIEFDERYQTSYKNILVELSDGWPLTRAETLAILNAENILARAYYSPPLHSKAMSYEYIPAVLPQTELLSERFMLLPCGHMVSIEDIGVIVGLLNFISRSGSLINQRMSKNVVK